MVKHKNKIILFFILAAALCLRLFALFKTGNDLSLDSDDLNYIKSAVVLKDHGIFTFFDYYLDPTVFVMPFYPFFLALIFKIFGHGAAGLLAGRIIQVLIGVLTVYILYLLAKKLAGEKTALIASALWTFYPPAVATCAFYLTETLFVFLLLAMLLFAVNFSIETNLKNACIFAVFWISASMTRPTIAIFPAIVFLYLLFIKKRPFLKLFKYGILMVLIFVVVFSFWWIRNYNLYSEFIPLSAASGNPMLNGAYIGYDMSKNPIYYEVGNNTFERNKNETAAAKKVMKEGFQNNFWPYLWWYAITKTKFLWSWPFYWRDLLGIGKTFVQIFHSFMLLGFAGVLLKLKKFDENLIMILLLIYHNIIHCIYLTFDRYGFPMMPLLAIYLALLIARLTNKLKVRFI